MNQRSKLEEYLEEGNYEMAIQYHTRKPQKLSDEGNLSLAHAYFAAEYYEKTLKTTTPLRNHKSSMIYFEANILYFKTQYLLQQNINIDEFKAYRENIQRGSVYEDGHKETIQEISQILLKSQNYQGRRKSKRELEKQGEDFNRIKSKDDVIGPADQGMPMFLVSQKWFQIWESFVGLRKNKQYIEIYPGPISNFSIIKHHFNCFYDKRPSKKYTNYSILNSAKYKLLTKSCWQYLKNIYTGIQVKRYNITVDGRQILAEIYLKKIVVKNSHNTKKYVLQITKKQTWGGVIKKLQLNLHYIGFLYEQKKGEYELVDSDAFLEQVDTVGKEYLYSAEKYQASQQSSIISKDFCQNCKKTKNLKFCQCRLVKYCDMQCLRQDRQKHKKKCQLQINHIKEKSANVQNFKLAEKEYSGKKGIVGLKNLGNTCYMNSGIQCLSNTRQITEYFMSNKFLGEINSTNPLGTKGNLACAYAELIREMWTGPDNYVSPHNLKKMIGKFAGQFSGYTQQDSQQLISYLIDGLQEDLNLVKKKETFEVSDKIIPDEQASLESEQNYAKRIQSYIRNVMVGQYKSTVICSVCDRKSICFDPFMLITLPIPSIKEDTIFYISSDFTETAEKNFIEFDNSCTLGMLKQKMLQFRKRRIPDNVKLHIAMVNLDTRQTESEPKDNELICNVMPTTDEPTLLCYQIPIPSNNQNLYRIQYQFHGSRRNQQKKLSYAKYCVLPKKISDTELQKYIIETYQKYSKRFRTKQILNGIKKEGKTLIVSLNENIPMLTCHTDRTRIKLSEEKALGLNECFLNFTNPETLKEKNEWYCNKCKKFVKATKQMEVYKTNRILVIAFKRFSRFTKVKTAINFPLQGFNIGPYLKENKEGKKILYDLYGVVNHYGSMGGGHYTAYCQNYLNNRWYEFDDSRVCEMNPKSVISQNAYVLFYRRR